MLKIQTTNIHVYIQFKLFIHLQISKFSGLIEYTF